MAEKIERVGVGMTIRPERRRSALAPFSPAFFHVRFHLAGRQYHGDRELSAISFSLFHRPSPPFFFHPLLPLFVPLFLSFARVIIASARKTSISPFRKESLSLLSSRAPLACPCPRRACCFSSFGLSLSLSFSLMRALGLSETARNANPSLWPVFSSLLHTAHTRARAAFKSFLSGSRD